MAYPSVRDWLFSVKTFAAAMLALYLALVFELPRPYWAMASVYIVSNPFVGATRSKALYRALGTALGAAGAILVVPPFVETPFLFSIVVAAWTGTMLFLAISDRTARSYVFLLAGYTLPLIALPTVFDPTSVFDVAIARAEEITLGIVCASIVGSVVLPSRLAPTLIERTDAWFRDAAF
ncbi:MAG TPA: FUSC family protein, partial [Paraburkholderia sp.]